MTDRALKFHFGKESQNQLVWLKEQAADWQPKNYKAEVRTRIKYLDGDMKADLLEVIREEFENTWEHMQKSLVTLPMVSHIIKKKSQVFEGNGRFFLTDASRTEIPNDSDAAILWQDIIRESLIWLALKRADQVVEQNHSAGLKPWYDKDHVTVSAFTPDKVDIVVNPDREIDPYSARAVLFQRTGIGGIRDKARFEIWGAEDPTVPDPEKMIINQEYEPTVHFITDGRNSWRVNEKNENPFIDPKSGKRIYPYAWLTDNRDALYSLGGNHLVEMNRIVNWGLSYLHHAMNWMSLGIPVYEKEPGSNVKLPQNRIISPKHALALPPNVRFSFVRNDIQLDSITNTYELLMQYHAMMSGIDPANMSVEQVAARSGFSIKLEMSGLEKYRTSKIEIYRADVIRLLNLVKIMHNYYAESVGRARIPDELQPDWSPGEIDIGPIDYIELGNRYEKEIEYSVSTVDDWAGDVHRVDPSTAQGMVDKNAERNAEILKKGTRFPAESTAAAEASEEIRAATEPIEETTVQEQEAQASIARLVE